MKHSIYIILLVLPFVANAQAKVRIGSNSYSSGGGSVSTNIDSVKLVGDSLKLFSNGASTGMAKVARFLYPTTPADGDFLRFNSADSTWRNTANGYAVPVDTMFPVNTNLAIRSDVGGGTLWLNDGTHWKRLGGIDSVAVSSLKFGYKFSGTSQNIAPQNGGDFRFPYTQAWTVGFWARLTATSGVFRMGYYNGTSRIWDCGFYYNNGCIAEGAVLNAANTSYYYSKSSAKSLNTWYYITITYNGSNAVKVYVNGADETVTANSGTVSTTASGGSFTIGQMSTFTSSSSHVDDLFIANVALTAAQVTNLYNSGSPNPSGQSWYSAVIGHWKFNQSLTDEKSVHNGSATVPQYVSY